MLNRMMKNIQIKFAHCFVKYAYQTFYIFSSEEFEFSIFHTISSMRKQLD